MRRLFILLAIGLCFCACEKKEHKADETKDLSVTGKQYEFQDEHESYFNAYEICNFRKNKVYFGYGPSFYHIIKIDSFLYEQKGKFVTMYKYEDNADTIRAISFGDSIIVEKKVYMLYGIPVVVNKRVYKLTVR